MVQAENRTARRTRRSQLLNAAMDVFAEQGFSGATISEIERRVGLAAGTGSLYRHFPSKEAVFKAAVEHEVARCRKELEATRNVLPAIADPVERQMERFRQTLQSIKLFNRMFRLMLNDGVRVPETTETVWAAVRRPTERHSERQVDLQEAIALASLGGYYLFSLMQGRPFDGVREEDFIRFLAELTTEREPKEQTAAGPGRKGAPPTPLSRT